MKLDDLRKFVEDFSTSDLAFFMKDTKATLEDAKEILEEIQETWDNLRLVIVPEYMEEQENMSSVNIKGAGRIQLAADLHVSRNKEIIAGQMYQWLRENEYEDIVVDYVHPGTLKSMIKEQTKKGEEFPEEIFSITPFTRASIVKS